MSTEAETLRRAAALMRERAEAATPGPWEASVYESGLSYRALNAHVITEDMGDSVAECDYPEYVEGTHGEEGADAYFIASWHPVVALAVADWLERVAEDFDENTIVDRPDVGEYVLPAPDATWCDYCGGAIASPHYSAADQRCDCYRWPTALAVARAYLGIES